MIQGNAQKSKQDADLPTIQTLNGCFGVVYADDSSNEDAMLASGKRCQVL
jgi:hypothetical protein